MMLMTARACSVCATNYSARIRTAATLQIRGSFSQVSSRETFCRAGAPAVAALSERRAEFATVRDRRYRKRMAQCALVTGAAGLIGSHIVDLLVREGWRVRALDNLEPQTHRRGKPAWINPKAEFVLGDMRNRDAITAALDGMDVVFHQA